MCERKFYVDPTNLNHFVVCPPLVFFVKLSYSLWQNYLLVSLTLSLCVHCFFCAIGRIYFPCVRLTLYMCICSVEQPTFKECPPRKSTLNLVRVACLLLHIVNTRLCVCLSMAGSWFIFLVFPCGLISGVRGSV